MDVLHDWTITSLLKHWPGVSCWHVHFLGDESSKTIVHIELEEVAAWVQVAPTISRSEFIEVINGLLKHNTYSTNTIDYTLPHSHLLCLRIRHGIIAEHQVPK